MTATDLPMLDQVRGLLATEEIRHEGPSTGVLRWALAEHERAEVAEAKVARAEGDDLTDLERQHRDDIDAGDCDPASCRVHRGQALNQRLDAIPLPGRDTYIVGWLFASNDPTVLAACEKAIAALEQKVAADA